MLARRAGCFIRKLGYHLQSEFCGHTSTWGTVHKEAGIRSTAVRWLASTSDFWAKQRALQGSSRGDFKASRRNDSVLAVPATNSQVHVFWDIDNKTALEAAADEQEWHSD
ncbi:hypothetical protein WJX75_009054 [Coccomyxa subellipsoidea]|uniref:Uncharacterized protein n=1 Tax=Coccomyxa subellipsoidea TaxID=248742 RepID=A0ABR2YLH9_9CHLO